MKIEERVIRTIEEQAWIDRAAVPIQTVLRGALHRAPSVAGFLHGDWLGHPLHAALIPLPIGAFTTAMVLDIVELTGNRRHRRVADAAVITGIGSALIAALPGLADWSHTEGGARRAGFVHAALNVSITGIYGGSAILRAVGQRKAGIALAMVGDTLLGASAWLGGELAYRYGVGVRREAKVTGAERAAGVADEPSVVAHSA